MALGIVFFSSGESVGAVTSAIILPNRAQDKVWRYLFHFRENDACASVGKGPRRADMTWKASDGV